MLSTAILYTPLARTQYECTVLLQWCLCSVWWGYKAAAGCGHLSLTIISYEGEGGFVTKYWIQSCKIMGTAAPFCLSYGSFWLDLEAKFQHPFGCIKLPHILVWNCKRHNDYMLDNMCLGPYMFWKSIVLRDSMLVGTLLSCSEAWYNVSEAELGQIPLV